MNIFSYLFQPDKSKLSPIGRAFIAWLEIVIISVLPAIAGGGLEYLNGHPGDWTGLVQFIVSAMVIALLKGFTTLGVSMKNTSVTLPDVPPIVPPAPAPPQPPVIIHNNMPASPEPRIIQLTTPPPPAPAPIPVVFGPVTPPVPQFKTPLPLASTTATVPPPPIVIGVSDINTNVMPAVTPMANGRDWTGLEIPAVQP